MSHADELIFNQTIADLKHHPLIEEYFHKLSFVPVTTRSPGGQLHGARLPELLQQHQPKLVIISIGGNDFLQRLSNSDTQANIAQSIALSQQSGAQVLLVAVPELTLAAAVGHPNDHAMYAQLAQSHQVYLLEDAWSDVLGDDSLRADPVHANDAGYQVFSKLLVKRLQQIGWLD